MNDEPRAENDKLDEIHDYSNLGVHLELGCWMILLLSPVLYHVHGAAVSRDQFVVRCILVGGAGVSAILLCIRRCFHLERRPSEHSAPTERGQLAGRKSTGT